jgi:hypothetical protein
MASIKKVLKLKSLVELEEYSCCPSAILDVLKSRVHFCCSLDVIINNFTCQFYLFFFLFLLLSFFSVSSPASLYLFVSCAQLPFSVLFMSCLHALFPRISTRLLSYISTLLSIFLRTNSLQRVLNNL